jgi:hypothetical protein
MILADNETKLTLLNNETIAKTIIELLREKPDRPVTIGVHGDRPPRRAPEVPAFRTVRWSQTTSHSLFRSEA